MKRRVRLSAVSGVLFALAAYGVGAVPGRGVMVSPGFPIGLYCVEEPAEFREIAKAGFNIVQGYRFEGAYPGVYPNTHQAIQSYLDAASAEGLRVLMGITQDAVRKRRLSEIRDRVIAFRNHPAIFGWQLYDEPETAIDDDTGDEARPASPEALRAAYALIRQLDPNHPVSIATSVTLDTRYAYLDTADVFMPDFMPIPLTGLEDIAMDIDAAVREAIPRGKWVIPHVQAYNLANDPVTWPTNKPKSLGRYPRQDEMRFMAYFAITRRAAGVFFNCYRFDYGTGLGADDISPQANPGQWRAVASVASELDAMAPIFAAPTVEPWDAGLAVGATGPLSVLIKRYRGQTYLVTANASSALTEATIRMAPERFPRPRVTEITEARTLAVRESSFTDRWSSYDVRVYAISSGTGS